MTGRESWLKEEGEKLGLISLMIARSGQLD